MKKKEYQPTIITVVNPEYEHTFSIVMGEDDCTVTTKCSEDKTIIVREREMTRATAMALVQKYMKITDQDVFVANRSELEDAIHDMIDVVCAFPYLAYHYYPTHLQGWNGEKILIRIHRGIDPDITIEVSSHTRRDIPYDYCPSNDVDDTPAMIEFIASIFSGKKEDA